MGKKQLNCTIDKAGASSLGIRLGVVMSGRPRIGISRCLLGENVRYDGGHKLNHYLRDVLGKYADFTPVCPEAECGLGIPREAMRLIETGNGIRLITQKTHIDKTEQMNQWISARLRELEGEDLDGFIFKSGSPSSGMERVKVYNDKGNSSKTGTGLFAKAFMARFPLIPVEDEGRLNDIGLRENFIVRIFAFNRWKQQRKADSRPTSIIAFHARHKYLLMAHNPAIQKELGKVVARIKDLDRKEFLLTYESLFMTALRYKSTVKKNVNVLQHMAGYFENKLTPDEKNELKELIDLYRQEIIPLVVPVTLIRHFGRKFNEKYLTGQYYLEPNPQELKLRNHA